MPRKVSIRELHEPYESYSYAELRHELSIRCIRFSRRVTNRANFIKLLRDWDKKNPLSATRVNETSTPITTRRTMSSGSPTNCTRSIRARRGCRFRLINVLLSPEFNGRWDAMTGKLQVNELWLDVHTAFMSENSMLDAIQFHDALFVNVTPNVILPHSPSRLLQMWTEIVAMYRNAVAQAKEAAANNGNTQSFFDFCAGRLDLLYLHMAMLLEPKLYEFILSDKIPIPEPFSKSKAKLLLTDASDATNGKSQAAVNAVTRTTVNKVSGKTTENHVSTCAPTDPATATTPSVTTDTFSATSSGRSPATVAKEATQSKACKVPTQNPEMEEVPAPARSKARVIAASTPMAAAGKANNAGIKVKQTNSIALAHTPAAQKDLQKAAGKGKTSSGASLAKEAKGKVSPSKPKPTAAQPKAKAASNSSDAKRSPLGKRSHGVEDTAIVEVPSVTDIVPHPGKRVHTTTTISSALAPRSTEMMLPPDEWDILESRLRKVNENIARCHHGLASVEVTVSESYKQSLEADLRFYSAIKQRLQEQLLVVMQSGY
ncbi:unnamed protein product [Peronospora belbahrii]|uniref:Uncharacterized protein n=1 Tax=Peronospora belbahrii TaxID=622444 RepID=A0ABN8CM40_9STRA|nr:unnamed protein product [Peronospora belbahrii]